MAAAATLRLGQSGGSYRPEGRLVCFPCVYHILSGKCTSVCFQQPVSTACDCRWAECNEEILSDFAGMAGIGACIIELWHTASGCCVTMLVLVILIPFLASITVQFNLILVLSIAVTKDAIAGAAAIACLYCIPCAANPV